MKKIFLFVILCLTSLLAGAQEYSAYSAGKNKNGHYLVDITVSSKSKIKKNAEDLVLEYAVHGVMFHGLMASESNGDYPPLIKDPNIEQTKAEFFKAFFDEGAYKKYASVVASTLSVMKNKQTKKNEVSAQVMVNKEALTKYLENSGIIKGFSNLW